MAASLSSVSKALNRKLFDIPRLSPAHDIARQGPFKFGAVRWAWEFWFRALAPGGRYFFLATALFFLYGCVTLEAQSFVPFAYALAVWCVAEFAKVLERPGVEVRAHHAGRIAAGDRLPVLVEIVNRRQTALSGAHVMAHRLPDAIDFPSEGGVALASLEAGGAASVTLELSPRRRGFYELHGFRVETAFPFGLVFASRAKEVRSKLLVTPQFSPIERLELPPSQRHQPGGVSFAASRGESVEYIGNRDYREGDPVRDIDWRATARLSRPIVREFREELFLRSVLVLDTHLPEPTAALLADFERAVSLCAACGECLNRTDFLVDALASGPELHLLQAGRGAASLDQMLDILAGVQPTEFSPWKALTRAVEANLEGITSVVCLFLDWDEERRAFATLLQSGGGAVKIIIVRDQTTSGPTTLPTQDTWPGVVVLGAEEWKSARDL